MSSRFQTAVLGSSLFYPNAVAWSDENLVAVAAGANVVIMSPSNPGVRGLITIPSGNQIPVGVIDGEDTLLDGCLLTYNLSRDTRPCVRSISWSPVGLANNAGCLISVCTSDGQVKLYRSPFCEFSAEWIEVVDISEFLYTYLKNTGFGEYDFQSSENFEVMPTQVVNLGSTSDLQVSPGNRKKRKKTAQVAAKDHDNMRGNNKLHIVPISVHERKHLSIVSEDQSLPLITARQYASRNAMLMSLSVAWSPIVGSSGCGVAVPDSSFCSFLAVGGKCGRISLWRVNAPQDYSIDNPKYSGQVSLAGLFRAHSEWVTSIDWASGGQDVSNPQLLLATGSSDGSVKVWRIIGEELLNSSGKALGSFSLLKEVISVDSAMVSVLEITTQSQAPWKLLLAVGKGSGSFEVWNLDMETSISEKIGCYYGHGCIVTGLAWAFDGCCLYSCSQDNSTKCWSLEGNSLSEVPIPSGALGVQSYRDVHYVFESCFGLAISPGNLAMAVARGIDIALLHPMYEQRTHKAAIEFLWIGGQQLRPFSTSYLDMDNISVPGLPERELIWWENNILWSLNLYKVLSRILNIWDVLSALLAFKQSAPEYLEHLLIKWLASCIGLKTGSSTSSLSEAITFLPKLSTRLLQLINIIIRRVILRVSKENNISGEEEDPEGLNHAGDQAKLWKKLLLRTENELLERLICLKFSAILNPKLHSSMNFLKAGTWSSDGFQLMRHWISQNEKNVKDHSSALAKEIAKIEKRNLEDTVESEEDEYCTFCSAVVPLESTEYAFCYGFNTDANVLQKHKLERCAISMRILPPKPSWYCMCCQRRAMKLPPSILFTMDGYPTDFISYVEFLVLKESCTPCCLFCGILLQRSQPEYSLSPCFV